MMTLQQNKQKMFYALQVGQIPIYETDENGNIIYYTDNEGNKIPLETGETEIGYTDAIQFFGNISMSSGESEALEFGIDVSDYDATLIVDKGAIPINETSLIWFENDVGYKDVLHTIIDPNTADYKVLAVKPSINTSKFILGKLPK